MHRPVIKARLAVQVGHLYKRRNAERSFVHVTRRARQRRASTLLTALRRDLPENGAGCIKRFALVLTPCAAARAAPEPFSESAESLTIFLTGC